MIGDDCKLLFVGINPGRQTAMTGIHFAHPSNRFWPALKKAGIIDWVPNVSPVAPAVPLPNREGRHRGKSWTAATNSHFCHPSNRYYPALREAGIIDWVVDPETGMTDEQRADLVDKGVGITNLVHRATARASELRRPELEEGRRHVMELVESLRPRVVAVAGVTAYRMAFGDRFATLGEQPEPIGPATVWVVPNPSGLNAHETVGSLANWYRRVADEAGLV
jgi:TDG/mug DNA glycosylase family protein